VKYFEITLGKQKIVVKRKNRKTLWRSLTLEQKINATIRELNLKGGIKL
jgi:hypothetical protein